MPTLKYRLSYYITLIIYKAKRLKLRFLPLSPNRSLTPIVVDKDIAQDRGLLVAIEKSNERL